MEVVIKIICIILVLVLFWVIRPLPVPPWILIIPIIVFILLIIILWIEVRKAKPAG